MGKSDTEKKKPTAKPKRGPDPRLKWTKAAILKAVRESIRNTPHGQKWKTKDLPAGLRYAITVRFPGKWKEVRELVGIPEYDRHDEANFVPRSVMPTHGEERQALLAHIQGSRKLLPNEVMAFKRRYGGVAEAVRHHGIVAKPIRKRGGEKVLDELVAIYEEKGWVPVTEIPSSTMRKLYRYYPNIREARIAAGIPPDPEPKEEPPPTPPIPKNPKPKGKEKEPY